MMSGVSCVSDIFNFFNQTNITELFTYFVTNIFMFVGKLLTRCFGTITTGSWSSGEGSASTAGTSGTGPSSHLGCICWSALIASLGGGPFILLFL